MKRKIKLVFVLDNTGLGFVVRFSELPRFLEVLKPKVESCFDCTGYDLGLVKTSKFLWCSLNKCNRPYCISWSDGTHSYVNEFYE